MLVVLFDMVIILSAMVLFSSVLVLALIKNSEHEQSGKFKAKVLATMTVSLLILSTLIISDAPVSCEKEKEQYVLAKYQETGMQQSCYLVYDNEIRQYKYSCVDGGKQIGTHYAEPLSSKIIKEKTEVPRVEVRTIEERSKLTKTLVSSSTEYIFFIPDEECAVLFNNN
ncbi:hypothetical protein IJG78_01390 [Candidatus Saccharibacteria bacterium]|nr:hypothetical protein [Candidatus Saccharibacteria bacterium]